MTAAVCLRLTTARLRSSISPAATSFHRRDRMTEPNVQPEPITASTCWPRLLTVEKAALYLGVSRETLKKNGIGLPRLRAGRKVLYDRELLDRLIDGCPPGADIWVALPRQAR